MTDPNLMLWWSHVIDQLHTLPISREFRMKLDRLSSVSEKYRFHNQARLLRTLFRLVSVNPSGKKVLDVACGYGLETLMMLFFKSQSVFACDLSHEKIREAHKVVRNLSSSSSPAVFITADGGFLPFPSCSMDIVFIREALGLFRHPIRFVCEALRVLKSKGVLLIQEYQNRPFSLFLHRKVPTRGYTFSSAPLHSFFRLKGYTVQSYHFSIGALEYWPLYYFPFLLLPSASIILKPFARFYCLKIIR